MTFSSSIGRIVEACWVVFALYWLVAATTTKRTVERDNLFTRLVVLGPLVVAFELMRYGWHFGPDRIVPLGMFTRTLGCLVCVVGLAFTIWARRTLGGNWSGSVTFKEDHELIQRGPYALVRHPIYTGLLLMLVGTVVVLGRVDGFVALVIVVGALWWKLRREEAMMTKHFPGAYPAYRARVKALIPFVL
jgi:protein-S-isoprenylcysteine O-methyltransferase Ste14